MTTRKASVSATGGRMLNPSVEPTARRDSERARRESEGNLDTRNSLENSRTEGYDDRGDSIDGRNSGATLGLDDAEITANMAALEARKQRRCAGLKRLNLNNQLKETLLQALEGVTLEMRSAEGTAGIEKLQAIMTEAKEKGFGLAKLFHFFLLEEPDNSSNNRRKPSESSEGAIEESIERVEVLPPAKTPDDAGSIFRDTVTSKTRAAEISKKKHPMDRMPSLKNSKRPSTAGSKRGSSSSSRLNTARCQVDTPGTGKRDDSTATKGWRQSMSRRASAEEEDMLRDKLISSESFQQGLASLGFKLTDEDTLPLFRHLDMDGNGKIDLSEFTRFCLEIPSKTWKAERARRGIFTSNPGTGPNSEFDRAAREIAIETVSASLEARKRSVPVVAIGTTAEGIGNRVSDPFPPAVELGKIVFKGEKFFWRTKDLIEVVIQLNADKDFLAISTFHTDTLEVYPVIFVDPFKIPNNATAVAMHTKALEDKKLETKQASLMGVGGADKANSVKKKVTINEGEKQTLAERAHMLYIADYLLNRLNMPDQNGNLLQPDVTQPGVQINPTLPSNYGQSEAQLREETAKPRPGLKKTSIDEWETLLIPNPPINVVGAPEFSKTKRRESYFQEFLSTTGEFDENRIKAQRLSEEAEAFSQEVSRLLKKLAPLNYSALAPAILQNELVVTLDDPLTNAELGAKHKGGGRVVLDDGLSQGAALTKHGSARTTFLES